ncbi:MAG: HAMP domain-containing histidine kinase [Acidobacteriota bacterium]|nr:MAG: HAMP domain-containing histidine kinase [Acidobacteriota bacterium]
MIRRARGRRVMQISMLILLVVCSAQVLWWFVDQERMIQAHRARMIALWRAEGAAAQVLLETGVDLRTVEALFPHIEVGKHPPQIRQVVIEDLDATRFRRLNRYAWEGGFFVVVLFACMAVIWRTLRQEASLRQRQQNFIAAVTHELKSPLASLQLSAETMAMRQLEPERQQILVRRVLDDLVRMEDLISKILDTSRLEQGRFHPEAEPVALDRIVEGVVSGFAERAETAGVIIEQQVPTETEIFADPDSVKTVVRNLMENAIKATASTGGGRVTLRAQPADGFIRFTVEDTGVGFAPSEAERLFQKFYRPGDEMRRRSTGTGLGLFIVRRMVSANGGRVKAFSAGEGRVALFTVDWRRPREAH